MDEKEKEELLKEIEDYTKKIEEEPDNASYWNNRGNTFYNLKEYEKAIEDYNKAIELEPSNAFYYNKRGNVYYHFKEYEKAIEDYNKAIELDPSNASYYNNRGNVYYRLKEYEKAIEDYKRAIELNPNYISVYNSNGLAHSSLGEYKKAIDEFDKAIKLNPNNAFYYNNRGFAYGELEKYQEAIEDYDKAIELDPKNAFYYFIRGYAYGELEKYQEAIKDYDKAIELDPKNDSYFNSRGTIYNNLHEYNKAIEDINIAIKLNPKNASYFNNRGTIYNNLHEYNKAIEDINIAIKLNPNYTLAYNNRGFTLHNLGKFEEAIENFNKAIELDPNYKSAIENKEFSLKKLKNLSQTNEILEPKYQIIFNKAKALHLQGEIDDNFEKAEKEFSSFINKYKDSPNKSPELENLLTEATSYQIASKFKVKRFIGYLTFADILGWKGIWQKQNTPNGKVNYAECLFSIKNSLKNKFNNEQNFYNINLISDTFVVFSEDFKQSNELSKNLIEQCLEKGLLIRGATSYGECYNKDMVYVGQAVDEAASWHEKGEEIGIYYTSSARLSINLSNLKLEKYHLINDEVNTKIGKIKTYFINWYNKTTEKKFYEIMKKEIIYPEISLKYFNTENRLNKILHSKKKKGKNNVKNR